MVGSKKEHKEKETKLIKDKYSHEDKEEEYFDEFLWNRKEESISIGLEVEDPVDAMKKQQGSQFREENFEVEGKFEQEAGKKMDEMERMTLKNGAEEFPVTIQGNTTKKNEHVTNPSEKPVVHVSNENPANLHFLGDSIYNMEEDSSKNLSSGQTHSDQNHSSNKPNSITQNMDEIFGEGTEIPIKG